MLQTIEDRIQRLIISPPPPIPQERVVVDDPLRPPQVVGEVPIAGAPRLVPVRAYVEGQGWIRLYQTQTLFAEDHAHLRASSLWDTIGYAVCSMKW